MQKELLSLRQAVCTISTFLLGSSMLLGANTQLGQDSWLGLLYAMIIAMPIILIYARIIKLYPEKDIYDILMILFGNIIGKLLIFIITFYAIHLGALVLRNFTDFLIITALPETPQIMLLSLMFFLMVYIAKSGIETLGKWSVVILPIVIVTVLLTILFSFDHMEISNLKPIMEHSFFKFTTSAFNSFAFPFGEIVLFLTLAGSIKKEDSPYRVFYYGLFLGGVILLLANIRNLLILGAPMVEASYFPSYTAARTIDIGNFLTRIEGSISLNFIITGFTKVTTCLLAASHGIAKLFSIKSHNRMIVPAALLMITLGDIVYNNLMGTFAFNEIYAFYAAPFQILIPFIVWITAEVKSRKKKTCAAPSTQNA